MNEERQTRLFMISPKSAITPDQLVRTIHTWGYEVIIKETCYGCIVEGSKETVSKVLCKIRENYRNEIFSKIRAYRCSDPRRCRAQHGVRPGYAQLEEEWNLLAKIQYGLDMVDSGVRYKKQEERKYIPINDFKRICEVYL